MSDHQTVLTAFAKDRPLAHSILFKHRHPLATPPFAKDLIEDFHGQDPQVVDEVFRGGTKSTTGEEGISVMALLTDFENCLIVSSTEKRAVERLEAIRHELENNEYIVELFGEQKGEIWQATKIVLPNGVCIQALGVGQSVRGVKHHAARPDFIWADDIEDEESVRSPETSHARLKWLMGTLLPVCAKYCRVRVTGNRLSPDAVVTKLASNPAWKSRRIPICYTDVESGREVATWPEFRDIVWIEAKRKELFDLGLENVWATEYMCEAISETVKPFRVEDYRVVPRVRTWQAVYAMWDPAKTTKNLRQQSQYGKAVWSWIGNKIVVWDGWAKAMKPSELINDIFETEKEYAPVGMRVEADGLEEWLNEPLRIEQTRRRILLPNLGPERAPRDKDNFIRSLQPHFASQEIEFAKDIPEARAQLINFPSGKKDFLNALAYALKLRPGQLIYDNFTDENVAEDLEPNLRSTPYLALNADGTYVTGVLAQYDGTLAILGDWIEGGDAGQCIETICKQAALLAGKFNVIVPPKEMDPYDNKGVVAAVRRLPRKVGVGNLPERGRAEIRDLMGRRSKLALLQVSTEARWTLRAFSGGYHKVFNARGQVDGEAELGAYRLLMEGLESFAGIMNHEDEDDFDPQLYSTSKDGRQYRSLVGTRRS